MVNLFFTTKLFFSPRSESLGDFEDSETQEKTEVSNKVAMLDQFIKEALEFADQHLDDCGRARMLADHAEEVRDRIVAGGQIPLQIVFYLGNEAKELW